MAGLEGGTVAGSVDIEGGDGTQDGIGVDAAAVVVAVDVGGVVLPVPVGLEEAEDLRGLGACCTGDA